MRRFYEDEVSTVFELFLFGFVLRFILLFYLVALYAEFNSLSNGITFNIDCEEKSDV